MNKTSIKRVFGRSKLGHRFTVITVMFLSLLLGIIAYTITTISKEKSHTLLIDVAGRQRMLLQKHINEVFLSSQGITADYISTRELIRSTLDSLLKGGSVVPDSETGQRQTVPAVPTKEILINLREQRNHFDKVIEFSDNLLSRSPDDPEFHRKLLSLRDQNSTLIGIADQAVKLLNRHSESNITTMVRWEVITAFFVALLGVFVTAQGIRASMRLETEVAERKRAESSLRDSELFLYSIVENIPDMIFVKDAKDLRFLRFNKAGEELLGYPKEAMIGKADYDFFPKSEADFFTTKDQEVLSGKTLLDIPEEVIQSKAHGTRYLHTKKIPILDAHGTPQYLLGISEDITERKQAEEVFRKGERKFRAIFEQAPTGIATLDSVTGRFTQINQKYCDITGYSQEEMLDRTFQDITHPDDLQADLDHMQELLSDQVSSFQMEKRYIRKNGEIIWVNLTCVPLWLEPTDPRQHIAMVEDITERKEKEAQLKTLSDRLLLATASAKMGIWDWDITEDVLTWDEQMFNLYGLAQEDLRVGYEMWARAVHPEDRPQAETEVQQAVLGKEDFHTEFKIVWPDQSVHTTQAHAIVQRDDAGKPIRMIGVNWDISDQKMTEERLRESELRRIEALRQSDALKSALLSSVSHELRTPLTAMKASVSSIIGNAPGHRDQAQQEFLKGIDREINYMSHLVDNLLDMSQIEAGTLIPHKEWHPLEDLVEGALRRTEQTLETRNVEIHIPEDVPPVFVDAVEIQQVLTNLLDNAVKYSSPDSPIQIHVRPGVEQVEVQVSNKGETMQAQDLERIFERFYRRRSPRQQPIRGTGLGLAICKGIVEAHGGRIWAESIGRGVTITFTVPMPESLASFSLEGLGKS